MTLKYPAERFKVHQEIKLLALQIASDTLNLLRADVKQTQGRNKHFPWSFHRMEKLNFLGGQYKKKNSGKEFLLEIRENMEEFPVWDVHWSDDERAECREDSHFVGHVKDQRGDWDEDQAHPEDPRTEHHFGLSHTHTQKHTHIHLLSGHCRQCRVQQPQR